MDIFSSFGLSSPWILALFPLAVAGLVYAYRRRGRGQQILVASLLILKQLQKKSESRSKFVPPPRFFFELLLFLLLVLAISGLYLKSPGTHTLLIIDNSLSMSAKNASGSMLDAAKQNAAEYLSSLSSDAEVSLYTTSPFLSRLANEKMSPYEARNQLENIETTFSEDRIAPAIARLVQRSSADELLVYTDRHLEGTSLGSQSTNLSIKVNTVRKGSGKSELPNIAILAISEQNGLAKVLVGSFIDSPTKATIRLESYSDGKFSKISQRNLNLEPFGFLDLDFSLPETSSPVRIQIEADLGSLGEDSIAADNTAWLVRGAEKREMIVVSELSPKELGLTLIPGISFKHVKPVDFSASDSFDQIHIFHRVALRTLPPVQSLLIMSGLISWWQDGPDSSQPGVISSWHNSHEVLRYLNLSSLKLKEFSPLSVPAWGTELIRASGRTMAFAGIKNDNRYITLGTEVFPYKGKDSPLLSIFLLNAFSWLSEGKLGGLFIEPHTQYEVLGDIESAEYIDGEDITILRDEEGRPGYVPLHPGVVREKYKSGITKLRVVNFFSEVESNTGSKGLFAVPQVSKEAEEQEDSRSLVSKICFALLVLLLLEYLFFFFRSYRRKQVLG